VSRRSGVTLLEMLVALAVFGIVATVLYESFTRTLAARETAGARARTFAAARVALDWLEQDLKGSLSVRLYPTAIIQFSSSGHGGENTLSADEPLLDLTVRTSRRSEVVRDSAGEELAVNMSDQARVRYRLESPADFDSWDAMAGDSDESSGLLLVRYEWRPPLEEASTQSALRTVVARAVESIDFRFEDRGTIVQEWPQRTSSGGVALGPRLVEVRMVLLEADGASAEFATGILIPLGGRRG
jgi:prepilin-type N-terminal cleavage/methylation domain-containing protein